MLSQWGGPFHQVSTWNPNHLVQSLTTCLSLGTRSSWIPASFHCLQPLILTIILIRKPACDNHLLWRVAIKGMASICWALSNSTFEYFGLVLSRVAFSELHPCIVPGAPCQGCLPWLTQASVWGLWNKLKSDLRICLRNWEHNCFSF